MFTNFDFKVGWKCNNRCIHCVVSGKEQKSKDFTTKEIKKIIYEKAGRDGITFTGGEPTIRKDFIEILKFTKELGFKRISIQSNGRKFHDYNFANEVSQYADSILFTIHSHNFFVHDMITNSKKSWIESSLGLKNLYKIGKIHITSQTVISKLNISNLYKTYGYIQNLAPRIRMNLTFPHPNGSALNNFQYVVPMYSEIKDEIYKVLKIYGNFINTEAIPKCYLYPYHNTVFISENQYFDKNINLSGIDSSNKNNNKFFDDTGITNDYANAIVSEYRKSKECEKCIFNNKCFGIWKEYYEFYKDNIDLIPIKAGGN